MVGKRIRRLSLSHPRHRMQSVPAATFDQAYYQRFYFNKKTRVVDAAHAERLSAFLAAYLRYLRLPVRRVLDMGCGIGLWRELIARNFPGASYHGVEISDYLCQRYGWEHGSVLDYAARTPFDLVICQGVLPYLNPADLRRALANLGRLSRGALYIEAVSREDYERDVIDEELTDTRQFRHRAALYRRGLREHMLELGGGVWLSRQTEVPLFALEYMGGS
jgi:SAM-dependent methyltransferase